jgi:hypothetical protein
MYITIQCQKCGCPVMQKDIDMGIATNRAGIWLTIAAYCKLCNVSAVYYFREDRKREDPCQKK